MGFGLQLGAQLDMLVLVELQGARGEHISESEQNTSPVQSCCCPSARALTPFLPADPAGDLRRLAEPHGARHSSQAEHCGEGTQHHCAGQGPRGAAGLAQGADGRRRPLCQAGAETNPGAGGGRHGQCAACSPGGFGQGAWWAGGGVQDRPFPGTGRFHQRCSQVRAATAALGRSLDAGTAPLARPVSHTLHPQTHTIELPGGTCQLAKQGFTRGSWVFSNSQHFYWVSFLTTSNSCRLGLFSHRSACVTAINCNGC